MILSRAIREPACGFKGEAPSQIVSILAKVSTFNKLKFMVSTLPLGEDFVKDLVLPHRAFLTHYFILILNSMFSERIFSMKKSITL